MKPNIGDTDRVIRIVLGVLVILLGIIFKSWWGAAGLIFLFTALIRFCPVYFPFGFSTQKIIKTEKLKL